MKKIKKVLLVGLTYEGPAIPNTTIETRGLGRTEIIKAQAANTLYDYDLIIIYPKDYSRFIFGKAGKYSNSESELWDLKSESNQFDIDSVFWQAEREQELEAALKIGTRLICLLVPDKTIRFFGRRSLYSAYLNNKLISIVKNQSIHAKNSHSLSITLSRKVFRKFFEKLKIDGWQACISTSLDSGFVLAKTPDSYALGLEINLGDSNAWLLTPPTSDLGLEILIREALKISRTEVSHPKYHGIFLCHSSADKPFVRKLKKDLEKKGVQHTWIDEGELLIGDSLLSKIEEAIDKTKYFGVILSPEAVASKWVKRELEMAMTRELEGDSIVVLPLVFKKCELPRYVKSRVYGDFTSPESYKDGLEKLLSRLQYNA